MQPIALPEDVARSLLIHQVAPAYPMEALKTGMEGVVVLQAFVGKDGSIQDLKMVNGYMIFGHAALTRLSSGDLSLIASMASS